MAKKAPTKAKAPAPAKKPPRLWGLLVGNSFTPGGFRTRIRKPYFKTGNLALANACRKAKGVQELTPIQMEEYEAAQAALNPALVRARFRKAVEGEESARSEAQAKAEKDAAAANTAAQAAEQRAAEAADRVKELEAAKAKAETTKTGAAPADDGDLFGDGDPDEGSGLTLDDLDGMDTEELRGVLELYSIPAPSPATHAVLLPIAQEAVKGNIRQDEEAEAEAATSAE